MANDPKARRLVDVLRQVLSGGHPEVVRRPDEPPRKVLVYSEFGDTVDHVRRYLDEAFPNRVMTIRSLGRELAGTVRKNFDGACNKGLQQDQYEVLLATDKMSEGFNLNRAGLVINYDIPWNPTRVIQRLGRINRIGTKVFNNLYLFNFFPTEQGAAQHNVRQIAANKMFMIHTSIGEDSKIFSADEEPTAAGLFEKLTQNPDTLEEISFLTQARREWADICERHPQVKAKLEKLPGRVKTAERRGRGATYLFTRKKMTLFALRHRAGEGGEEPIVHLPIQDALAEIRCAFDAERCGGFSADFWPVYESLQKDLAERHAGSHPGVTSLIAKARNVLTGAIARGVGGHFARILLDDLQNHGTLSDRTLRMIINAAATDAALEAMIETMKNQMGVGYLEAIKDQLPDNEIVVAVEHQVAHRPSAQGAAPGA